MERLIRFASLILLLTSAPWLVGQTAGTSGEMKILELSATPSPAELAQARRAYKQGAIIHISSGAPQDLQRLLAIGGMTVTRKHAETSVETPVDDSHQMEAVRMTAGGALHQFLYLADSSAPAAGDAAFAAWAERESQTASGFSPAVGDPQPPAQAWTEVQQTTVAGDDNEKNHYQTTVSVFRLNDISSAGDWYMVLSDPEIQPNFHATDCGTIFNSCGWYTSRRIVTMTTSPAFLLFDHGPNTPITTETAGFTIGGSLSQTGPGVTATFTRSWQQPSVTTADKSDLAAGTAEWVESFEGQPFWNTGKPPATARSLFLSHQGSIFQVPEGTTTFGLAVSIYFKTTYHDANGDGSNDWTYAVNGTVSAPVVAVDPPALSIPAGSASAVQLTATIPNSSYGIPWNLTNLPAWLTASQTTGSGSTRVTLDVAPGTALGTTGSLNFNTNPEFAAPSVETNPLIVTVKVAPSGTTSGVAAIGGADFDSGGRASLGSAEIVEPQVAPLSPLNNARAYHTATRLQDGQLLVAGGSGSVVQGVGLRTAELFDPAANSFSLSSGQMTTARMFHTATLLANGKVLLAGGQSDSVTPLATAELFDPSTGNFTSTGSMAASRARHTATKLQNGDVLISGGDDANVNIRATAEIYHVASGQFTPVAAMHSTRTRHTSTLLSDGMVLIAGGLSQGYVADNTAEIFNPASGTFALVMGNLNEARVDHTATLLDNGQVLLTGGGQANQVTTDLASAELYDPETQSFRLTSGAGACPGAAGCMIAGRRNHTANLLPDGSVFLVGGFSGDGNHSFGTTEVYNPANNSFTAGPNTSRRAFHTATFLVQKTVDALTLTAAPNPSTKGQSVALTATLAPGTGTPTGTITFKDGATPLGDPVSVAQRNASLSITSLSEGEHAISATYSGDTNFAPSTSNVVYQTVAAPATKTSLTSSPNPSTPGGDAVVFTATVSTIQSSGSPSGTVAFKEGASVLQTVPLTNGQAVLRTSSLSLGTHEVLAVYSGDNTFLGSTSPVVDQVVVFATKTNITSGLNPSVLGQGVTLTAKVSTAYGDTVPTGTVGFVDGATLIGGPLPLTNGQVSIVTDKLAAGAHSIVAVFTGDTGFANSQSQALQQAVLAPTATSLKSSPNPSDIGQAVTLTATVASASGTPTGTITFRDGGNALGSPVLLTNGNATLRVTTLTAGSHAISAVYNGDSTYAGSAFGVTQVVKAVSTTSLTSSPNSSSFGEAVTLLASVAGPGGTPTGTVTFLDGLNTLGTGVLSGGKTTLTTTSLAVGNHSLTAAYGGDAVFSGSTSPAAAQAVKPASPKFTGLTPSQTIIAGASSIPLSGKLSAGALYPSGNVSISINGASTIAALASGGTFSAAFDTHAIPASTTPYPITYSYAGGGNFTNASDGTTALTVTSPGGPVPTTTTMKLSVATCVTGIPFQIFITVAPVPPATGVPQGQIVLSRKNSDGSITPMGLQFLDNTGQWNPDENGVNDSIQPGDYTLIAFYQGSQNDQSSTGQVPLSCVAQSGVGAGPQTQAVAEPKGAVSVAPELFLDGTKSTSATGGALLYQWTTVGSRPAALTNADTAMPLVQFGSGAGEYIFQLTVTDSAGASATDRVSILYAGR